MKYILYRIISAAFLLNVVYIFWLLCFHLNFLQIDLAGHMAGAMSLLRVGLHGYQDQFFQGYVTNLFYPPLEDFLLAAGYVASGFQHVLAFKVYLLGITGLFCTAIWLLSRQLTNAWVRSGFLCVCLLILNIKKEGVSNYQGLSFWDLLVTGLSSQILGGGFFLLLVRETIGRKRPQVIGALLCFTILSHIIMGLMAALLVAVFVLHERRKQFLVPLTLWSLLTAFFTLPFFASAPFLVSSKLVLINPWPLVLFAGIVLAVLKPSQEARVLLWAALLAFLPNIIEGPSSNTSLTILRDAFDRASTAVRSMLGFTLPAFHYYRLGMPALLLMITGTAVCLDRARPLKRCWSLARALGVSVACLWAIEHELGSTFEFYTERASSLTTAPTVSPHLDPSWGREDGIPRLWFIENGRRIDFGLESYLSLTREDLFFSKGLLWESSRGNVLITSALATQFGPPAILDYFYYYGYSCESRACLLEQMAYDQGLRGILYSTEAPPLYMTRSTQLCFDKILREGTENMAFTPSGNVIVGRTRYQAFSLAARNSESARRVAAVEQISPSDLVFYDDSQDREYFAPLLKQHFGTCVYTQKLSSSVFVRDEYKTSLQNILSAPHYIDPKQGATLDIKRRESGHYTITTTGVTEPVLLRIKLNYLPGLVLRDSNGIRVPLFEGLSGLVTYGKGEMFLDFEKPRLFIVAYGISLLAALLLCVSFLRTIASRIKVQ